MRSFNCTSPSGSTKARRCPRKAHRMGWAAIFLFFSACTAMAQQGSYSDLGDSGYPGSFARGVSDDGAAATLIAGVTQNGVDGTGNHAFLWTAGGLIPLQDYGQGALAMAISADGKTIAGEVKELDGAVHAALWDASGKLHDLGTLKGSDDFWTGATNISADGKVAVGWAEVSQGTTLPYYTVNAFRWTNGQYQNLGALIQGGNAEAMAANRDGSVVVGIADVNVNVDLQHLIVHAFLWTASSNRMVDLGAFGDPSAKSVAWGVSRDGAVIVGAAELTSGGAVHAASWTQAGVIRDLGVLPGTTNSGAWAVNADGSIIVGTSVEGTNGIAFRWTQATGMQDLGALLAKAGVNMKGVSLGAASGISGDGQFIVGGAYLGYGAGREGALIQAPASLTGDAWLVRYCDAACSGGAPFGGMTTAQSQQNSIRQVAQARSTVMAQQNVMAAPLLGDGQRIGFLAPALSIKDAPAPQTAEVGSFITVGSLEGGVFARFDTRYGFSILGGLAYQQETFQGAQLQPSLLAALAARYSYDGFGRVRPFAEAGGWAVPDAALSFTRSYMNGASATTAEMNSKGDLEYYYGRVGAVAALGLSDEIALSAEIGRERLSTRSFAEAASQQNPFNARGMGASDAFVVGRLRAQFSHALTPDIDATVWAARANVLDSASNFAANVAGFGLMAPPPSDAPWTEFGVRLGYRLQEGANIDILANGASGAAAGTLVHVGAALRYAF